MRTCVCVCVCVYVCVAVGLCVRFFVYCPYLHASAQSSVCVCVCVCVQACVSGLDVLMQSHLHPRDNSPGPLHSSILHCHLKKPITSSPSDSHRPLVHIKRPIYTDPLSLKLFFKGKILVCALLVSKARQHSRESTTYIKVTQEQEDTLNRV